MTAYWLILSTSWIWIWIVNLLEDIAAYIAVVRPHGPISGFDCNVKFALEGSVARLLRCNAVEEIKDFIHIMMHIQGVQKISLLFWRNLIDVLFSPI